MTLFFSTLFFLVFSDFFFFSFNFLFFLYFVYLLTYFYSKKNTLILPQKYFFDFFFSNFKILFFLFLKNILPLLNLLTPKGFKWKPLFKRSSYFGLYRSTRNQWLNK